MTNRVSYKDVINKNVRLYKTWWPNHAFHYTDVTNAVNILKEGKLYSRQDATKLGIMRNDNASRQVINMTNPEVMSYVRFYFRPLTPTQYHNEGYKPLEVRFNKDINANVPVPVFFIFDLEKILAMQGSLFSDQSQAGTGAVASSGESAYEALPFDKIYATGYMEDPQIDIKYRHAEILYPKTFDISSALCRIICRNNVDRETLLNMLRRESEKAFYTYLNLISVDNSCYENNGLFVNACDFYGDAATVEFSNTFEKKEYLRRNGKEEDTYPIEVSATFEWRKAREVVNSQYSSLLIDYVNAPTIKFSGLDRPKDATALYLTLHIEGRPIMIKSWQLTEAAVL